MVNLFVHPIRIGQSIVIVLLLQMVACDARIHDLSQAPQKPEQWGWSDQWRSYELLTAMALESPAIDLHHQLPADIDAYCMNYPELSPVQRLQFWSDLLALISYHESRHDSELTYEENFTDNNGDRVVSRGLLQLSIESSKGYDCPVEEAAELHDPGKNIDCAVRILNKWVQQDGVISQNAGWLTSQWKGAARYWSVLRQSTVRSAIQLRMQHQPYCRI